MDIVERKSGDRRRLARLISTESDAMQRDRLRSGLMVLQGRQALEVADVVGRSRRFVQRWAYAYRDGGLEAVRGRTAPGRQRRLSPEQEARFVQRVKAGATPRDGVASLRGPQIQGILGREVGKTFSLNGSRPTVVRQNGRKSILVFGIVDPATGWSMVSPHRDANTATMSSSSMRRPKSLAGVCTQSWRWTERAGTRRSSSSGHDEQRRCSCRRTPRN